MIRQETIRILHLRFSVRALPCLMLVALTALREPAAAFTSSSYKDTNTVANPCATLQPIAVGDAITVAVALGGNRSMWYNSSDPKLNVLSPCSLNTATQILPGTQVAVFRPMVDQLSLFQIYNQTLDSVATTFSGAASLLVYTGYNAASDNETIVSEPRTFSTPAVREDWGLAAGDGISAGSAAKSHVVCFSLPDIDDNDGASAFVIVRTGGTVSASRLISSMAWDGTQKYNFFCYGCCKKDDDCGDCGNSTLLCLDGNCATAVATCASLNTTNPDICFTRINVAFSGTDKNSLSFTSWMNVKSVTKYSLSALYFKADALLQKGIQSIIDEDNQVGTGGAV